MAVARGNGCRRLGRMTVSVALLSLLIVSSLSQCSTHPHHHHQHDHHHHDEHGHHEGRRADPSLPSSSSPSTAGGGRGWKCNHDDIEQPQVKQSPVEYPSRHGEIDPATGRRQVSMVWNPIRIVAVKAYGDSMSQDKMDYVTKLVNEGISHFSKQLQVVPVEGALRVERQCEFSWVSGSKTGECSQASAPTCGTMVNIPEDHYAALTLYNSQNGGQTWTTTDLPAGAGLQADTIIYVTAGSDDSLGGCEGGSTLAYAGSCQRDQNDRPVVGYMHFCSDKIRPTTDPLLYGEDVALAVHEMTHVIGFSTLSYPLFRRPDGSPYLERCPGAAGCTGRDWAGTPPGYSTDPIAAVSSSVVATSEERGVAVKRIVTPSVQVVSRLHYGCESAAGAELESTGGISTAGSHWEKRTMRTEYMTGSSDAVTFSVFSAFTLALLQDTGWYRVTWDLAQAMTWGRSQGCEFVTNKCVLPKKAQNGFCNTTAKNGDICSSDRKGIAYCGLAEYVDDLPQEFQYFDDGKIGGMDRLMDYCPFTIPYSNRRCDNTSSGETVFVGCGEGGSTTDCLGSVFGPASACMSSSLVLDGYTVPAIQDTSAGCYKYECTEGGGLRIMLPSGKWHDCSTASSTLVEGYQGRLFCPPAQELCWDQRAWIEKLKKEAAIQNQVPSPSPSGSANVVAAASLSSTPPLLLPAFLTVIASLATWSATRP